MSELSFSISKKIDKLKISPSITAYYSDINNWIIWLPCPKGYWIPENIKRVIAKGIECNIKTEVQLGKIKLKANAGYALTHSINYGDTIKWGTSSYGKQLPYIPVHSGNVSINVLFKGFFITYIHNYYSERFTTSSNDITIRDWLYPYYMNNLFVGKSFEYKKLNFEINFKLYNLFNEKYRTVLGRPMPQRNYLLLLSFRF